MAIGILKAILLYLVIIVSLRIMGKRQIGELQPTELVVTILISNIASLPIEDSDIPILVAVLPILTITCLEVFLSYLSTRFWKIRKLVEGNFRVIIRNGEICQKELTNLRISLEDLMEELRTQGIFDVRQVTFAAVETNGKISVYLQEKEQPYTMGEAGVTSFTDSLYTQIISNGSVLQNGVELAGISQEWIKKTLKQENCSSVKEVFLLSVNRSGQYYLVKKEGKT